MNLVDGLSICLISVYLVTTRFVFSLSCVALEDVSVGVQSIIFIRFSNLVIQRLFLFQFPLIGGNHVRLVPDGL